MAKVDLDTEHIPDELPRGRHHLSHERVLASQRKRLLRAMGELVERQGYAATTVSDVTSAARVSRNAFYELFTDKEDCFIAVCDSLAVEILDDMASVPIEGGWLTALRAGMHLYLLRWQQRESFTRAYFVDFPGAGPRAVAQRDRQIKNFVRLFRRIADHAREDEPGLPPLAPHAVEMVVLGITEMIAYEVRQGRVDELVANLEEEFVNYVRLMFTSSAGTTLRSEAAVPSRSRRAGDG